jgi:sn-glycerol 3-phosphate transport system permease protein
MAQRLELWLGRGVLLAVALFALGFAASEWSGVARFGEWLLASLGQFPASLQTVVVYFASIPFAQVLPSLLIGAVVGALVGFALSQSNGRAVADGRAVARPYGAIIGAMMGVLAAQVFGYLTRHCTYAPDAGAAQAVAGAVLTALLAGVLAWGVLALTQRRATSDQSNAGYFKGAGLPLLFLAPTLLSLLLFLYYPSVQTITLSLSSRRFPLPQERFVCLQNYGNLAIDPIYQNAFLTTLLLTVLIVVCSLAIALSIALLASQKIRGAGIYRTLLIFPFALSPVVAGAVFLAMFREGGAGLINYALDSLFGVQASWLRDAALARSVVVLSSVWNILGFNILFYIAGLQNVPKDLLEAASIDGANRLQKFWHITFPLLAPFTFFLLVTNVTYGFYGVYGAVDTLTQGGPPMGPAGALGGATDVLIFKLYQDAFNPGSPAGLAAAQAVVLFVMVAGITLLQFGFVERRITYSGE